ncbi:hypothetical protein [Pseudomonas sp.]|uniref:hypothetical protein n=1 Tax=Pseudomonas sp. TaxID=306 RepID=UPI003BB207EA
MDADSGANIIAGVALLVSIASAVYAWKSAAEARVANQISIHEYQKHLYEAFVKLNEHLIKEQHKLDRDKVKDFEPYARTAVLYVDSFLARKVIDFYNDCLELVTLQTNRSFALKALRDLQDDLIEREGEAMDRHLEKISSTHRAFELLDGDVHVREGKTAMLGRSIDAELMKKLKIVQT